MNPVILLLWLHGRADDPTVSNGEVDVIEFSGTDIRIEFIDYVTSDDQDDSAAATLIEAGLPVETWLTVIVNPWVDDEGYWAFDVVRWVVSDNQSR